MNLSEDEHLDVCHQIETGLREQYELHPTLTDLQCVFALENAKIAIKKEFGYAKNEQVITMKQTQGIINKCVIIGLERIDKVNNLTLKDYTNRLEKIRKSVKRHSKFGVRAYYEFIKNYV